MIFYKIVGIDHRINEIYEGKAVLHLQPLFHSDSNSFFCEIIVPAEMAQAEHLGRIVKSETSGRLELVDYDPENEFWESKNPKSCLAKGR